MRPKDINLRTDMTIVKIKKNMKKMTNNDLQNTTQKTKD